MVSVLLVYASVPTALTVLNALLGGFVLLLAMTLAGLSVYRAPLRAKVIALAFVVAFVIGAGIVYAGEWAPYCEGIFYYLESLCWQQ